MGRYDHIQDFACRISDLMWGGELGWDRPNGLTELAEAVRRMKNDAADALAAKAQAEEDAHYANGVTDLALQRRDTAEAQVAVLREALEKLISNMQVVRETMMENSLFVCHLTRRRYKL